MTAVVPIRDDISVADRIDRLRATFRSGVTRSYEWRMRQIGRLRALLTERQDDLLAALEADLGKSRFEGFMAEIAITLNEIDHTRRHLRRWMRPERVRAPIALQPARCRVVREPLGVALIIAPWNYPVQLALAPLVGALAAGNCAVVKPSEVSANTSRVLADLVPRYLDPDAVAVVEGGVPETTALLEQRFDHIFYTGNGRVGRIVMAAAAKHLTPVTLELGGKSPTIVDRTADLAVAARRIVWGKFFNAGQTCVAPDYVLADRAIHDALLSNLVAAVRQFYGDDPKQSRDYARIINERHVDRLEKLLSSGAIVCGGEVDRDARYIAPTILRDVALDSPVMADEIFGPILPVIAYDAIDDALAIVTGRDKPLALYVFTEDRAVADRVLRETSSGGACVNDVVAHLSVPDLPFGGVGESGMGAYHGRATFETFSHRKSVLDKSSRLDVPLRYPPYDDTKERWLRRLL